MNEITATRAEGLIRESSLKKFREGAKAIAMDLDQEGYDDYDIIVYLRNLLLEVRS